MISNFPILLADDDENDVLLVRRALKSAKFDVLFHAVSDGVQAVEYLKGNGKFSNRNTFPIPKLAVLDIKMPKKTGLEVLEWLRTGAGNSLKRLPVVIMSSSDRQDDINLAYELGVNAYFVKPNAFEELVRVFQILAEFWKDVASHPVI